jgi:triacylglycerol lipase
MKSLYKITLLCVTLVFFVIGPLMTKTLYAGEEYFEGKECATKYPILLIHGIAFPDEFKGIKYFGRIPSILKEKGAEIFYGGTLAWGKIEENADILYNKIRYLTEKLGYEKINIIAHSKGGLDARYLFYKYRDTGISSKIASFSTINTPHRGAVFADIAIGMLPRSLEHVVAKVTDFIATKIFREFGTDSEEVYYSLRSHNIMEMNKKMGDLETGIEGIYCQSWASQINGLITNPFFQVTHLLNKIISGQENDGMVAVKSAIYGRFRGVLGKGFTRGVSHVDVVDQKAGYIPSKGSHIFNAPHFFVNMVSELKGMGY